MDKTILLSLKKKKSCNLPTKLETIFLDPWRGQEGRGVGEVFFSILEVLMVINWKNTSTLGSFYHLSWMVERRVV